MDTEPPAPPVLRPTNPAAVRARTAELRAQALKLRVAGASLREIARQQGCSTMQASRRVKQALAEVAAETAGLAMEYRTLECQRLDRLTLLHWPKGDGQANPRVTDTLLRIMERRAKLLGLDAPVKMAETDAYGEPLAPAEIDLSKLTLEELNSLEALVSKATARAASEPTREQP